MQVALRKGIALAAMLLMAGVALGQTQQKQKQDEQDKQKQKEDTQAKRQVEVRQSELTALRVIKASALRGAEVRNSEGKDIGEIKDLAVDPNTGRVAYAALSFGGFLGMGDELFAVPLHAFDVITPDRIIFDVSKEELENAEGFDQDHWPTHATQRWAAAAKSQDRMREEHASKDMDQTTGKSKEQMGQHEKEGMDRRYDESRITSIKKASELEGMTVKNLQNEDLGEIEELYIDPDRSRVAYGVLERGGFLEMGEDLYAIPWECFQTEQKDNKLVLDITKDRLKSAPTAKKTEDQTWGDPEWVVTVYKFYRIEPYWQHEGAERGERHTM